MSGRGWLGADRSSRVMVRCMTEVTPSVRIASSGVGSSITPDGIARRRQWTQDSNGEIVRRRVAEGAWWAVVGWECCAGEYVVRWIYAARKGGFLTVDCPSCGAEHDFPQPYPYHAGFGDSVFLYNEAGNRTLVWGTYDPAYIALLGPGGDPWHPGSEVIEALERRLPLSPAEDRWTFHAPARCTACQGVLRPAMPESDLYYLEFPDSVILGRAGAPSTLQQYLSSRPST